MKKISHLKISLDRFAMASQVDSVQDVICSEDDDRMCLLPKENDDEQTKPSSNKDVLEGGLQKQNGCKRRKIVKDTVTTVQLYTEIFLKIVYPLAGFMEKNILVGVFKSLDFMPGVLLNHTGKSILFNESAWNSFTKHMGLIECYMQNKVCGKKTSIRLSSSDIEVENIKFRNGHCIRFRNLSKHDDKVVLSGEEFFTMINVVPAINRYVRQLWFSSSVIKDYLVDTVNVQPNSPLLYGPVDTSIYNRLPQEVNFYRCLSKNNYIVNGYNNCDDEFSVNGVLPITAEEEECSENEGKETTPESNENKQNKQ